MMARGPRDNRVPAYPAASYSMNASHRPLSLKERVFQEGAAPRAIVWEGALQGIPFEKSWFTFGGTFILLALITFPIYDCYRLMQNFNYNYWVGDFVPWSCIALCIVVFLLFPALCYCVLSGEKLDRVNKHDLAMTSATMATTLGLVLLFVSWLGSDWLFSAQLSLSSTCQTSMLTRPARLWYESAQALRKSPGCAGLRTIEDCAGFSELARMQDEYLYFKAMEDKFMCTGFCEPDPVETSSLLAVKNSSSPGMASSQKRKRPTSQASFLGLHAQEANAKKLTSKNAMVHQINPSFPPTLFTDLNFNKVTCQGAAARGLLFTGMAVTDNLWWQGVVLIGSSILIGFTDSLTMLY